MQKISNSSIKIPGTTTTLLHTAVIRASLFALGGMALGALQASADNPAPSNPHPALLLQSPSAIAEPYPLLSGGGFTGPAVRDSPDPLVG